MHMADALLSPAVGGTMWGITAGTLAWCGRRVKRAGDDRTIPLMGVLGAFVFAAQMINFTIPATGSSGHLGGGLLLAIFLGPCAALLTIASVLTVQALFFADGGLLALGCNIFNLGFIPCFLAWPIYRQIAGPRPGQGRLTAGAIAGAVVALQLGALGVVLQTFISGVSEIPLPTFLLLMLPIHLAIGVVEGVATALVVSFVRRARPEILEAAAGGTPIGSVSLRRVIVHLAIAAAFAAGCLSWFASSLPDGLEWSIEQALRGEELPTPAAGVHVALAEVQEGTAVLPDYGFRQSGGDSAAEPRWGDVDPGATVSGLVGGLLTLLFAGGLALLLKKRNAPT